MAEWHFRKHRPDEKVRNPIAGEYFSDEAIDRPAQALVREAIQNSLDAHGNDEPVSVRFYVSGSDHALDVDKSVFWFGGAWPHYAAPESGLHRIENSPPPCQFLTIEDFGTTGLEGDPRQ